LYLQVERYEKGTMLVSQVQLLSTAHVKNNSATLPNAKNLLIFLSIEEGDGTCF